MYGTQAIRIKQKETGEFENDVNMYGTQAPQFVRIAMQRLRMM